MHKIVIPGEPIPKARHRSAVVHGHVHSYDEQKDKKHAVRLIMHKQVFHFSEEILAYPACSVSMLFELSFPRSKVRAGMPPVDSIPHISKPDLDNLVKFYLDCGNGILWSDDKKIVSIEAQKCYSNSGRVSIRVDKILMPRC